MEHYRVRVSDDSLVFSAAHFITFGENVCEPLHGHNYRVAVEVRGPLDENQYVVDFVALRNALTGLVRELDHHVLLPLEHPLIRVEPHGEEVEVRHLERRWVFPRSDCALLPIANTTAELLARYLGQRLLAALEEKRLQPEAVSVEVEECFGQAAVCELRGR